MSQIIPPQPSPYPHRASATRPPPTLPPGTPVRADQAKQPQQQQHSRPSPHRHQSHLQQPPQSHHRMSMPSPGPSPKTTHVEHYKPQPGVGRPPKPPHNSASVSSRPSPNASSGSSNDSSLRETSRTNIRGSMPPPCTARQTSATLGWANVTSPSPKEQWLETPKETWSPHVQVEVRDEVETQFESLLDSLQVPATVRQKFSTVSQDVKSSILHSTITSNPTILSSLGLPIPQNTKETPKIKKRISAPLLRKAKSSSTLNSPGQSPARVGKTYSVEGEGFVIVASPVSSPNIGAGPMSPPHTPHRGQSMDVARPSSMRMSNGPGSSSRPMSLSLFGPPPSNGSMLSLGKNGGKGLGISMGEQPDAFIEWLRMYKGTDLKMEVARCKKLRMLLRHENTTWVGAFVEMGGYKLVLDRMQDLLDIEWREEQHDDQMLYELLRCVKALSTSEIGKTALRAHFPNPFTALSTLLFSEKKPGDLPSRQIIIELWLFLFELFPPLPNRTPGGRPTSVRFDEKAPVDITNAVRALLVPSLPDPTKDHHDFVTKAHRPRVFRAWVGELSDVCRDYFWIMCHASNTLWSLNDVDESKVEKPIAPGGATGGVEFEAMNYVTTHFKLLNALCKQLAIEDREKALQLHQDLMSSGMDRILVTFRKASTTYYPAVHLELARYVSLLQAVSLGGKLPYLISKMVGPPPEEVRRFGSAKEWLPMPVPLTQEGGRRGGWDARQ
ncbi:hypothetical protein IAR55_001421 [Kwoniella newhampshirensis]|uniref:Formin GTPase-binding domain-containing protein n=1 Tax=Kwoniella newhampshirensis TaxID=1651941 RepID=A0AAW0Z238_9TREE